MNALTLSMQAAGTLIAVAALWHLLQVAAMVQARALKWAWRVMTVIILCCMLADTAAAIWKLGTPVQPGDIAASIPHLLGPCFVFAVAWLSCRTARDLLSIATLRKIAFQDPLTGLANRRALDQRLADAVQRASRDGTALSVVLLDLDFFKRVNDRHGHEAGDVVLRNIGVLIASNTRGTELGGRYGGEEFMIIMPGIGREAAAAAADRLRHTWSSTTTLLPGGGVLRTTISFGVGTLQPGETPAALVRRADAALYSAKKDGRDRVSIAA